MKERNHFTIVACHPVLHVLLTDVLVRPALLPVPDGEVEALLGEVVHRARVVDELLVEVWALRPPLHGRLVPRRLRHGVQNTAKKMSHLQNL